MHARTRGPTRPHIPGHTAPMHKDTHKHTHTHTRVFILITSTAFLLEIYTGDAIYDEPFKALVCLYQCKFY